MAIHENGKSDKRQNERREARILAIPLLLGIVSLELSVLSFVNAIIQDNPQWMIASVSALGISHAFLRASRIYSRSWLKH